MVLRHILTQVLSELLCSLGNSSLATSASNLDIGCSTCTGCNRFLSASLATAGN